MASDFKDIFGSLFDDSDLGRRTTYETLLTKLQGQGGPINRFNRDQFSNQFGSTFNRFIGALGQRVLNKQEPISFAEYAENNYSLRDARRASAGGVGRSQPITSQARYLFRR